MLAEQFGVDGLPALKVTAGAETEVKIAVTVIPEPLAEFTAITKLPGIPTVGFGGGVMLFTDRS